MPYIGNSPGTGTRNRFIYTATASQTTFSGADDNGKTLRYSDGDYVDVYLNGICLVPVDDYTATSKTSIVLTVGAAVDDTLEVIAYDIATIADTVSKANGGTFEDSIGIGITPTAKLHVNVGNTTNNLQGVLIESTNSSASSAPDLTLYKNSSSPADNDIVGGLWYYGNNDASEQTIYAAILGYSTDVTDATEDGELRFFTTENGSVAQETMRINNSGYVNIGTGSDPDALLRLNSNTPVLKIRDTRSKTWVSGETLSSIDFDSADVSNTPTTVAKINVETDNGSVGTYTAMTFSTATPSALSEVARFSSDGSLFIGCTSEPAGIDGIQLRPVDGQRYFSRGSTAARYQIAFKNPNGVVGRIETSGSATSYITSSDYRIKENVVEVSDGITRLKLLSPKQFNFIADPSKTVDGFLAHEVQAVVPEAVSGEKDAMRDEEYEVTPAVLDADGNVVTEAVMGTRSVPEYQGIDQSKLVPLLTAALQEAIAKIETLETEMTSVKSRLDALEAN